MLCFVCSSVDATVLRVEDVHTRETQNRVVLQNLDWRMQRLEDVNMNMYTMLEKFTSRQPRFDGSLDQPQGRQKRRASLTSHDPEERSLPVSSHCRFLQPRQAPKPSHQFKRQSTIRRLNSPTNYQTNLISIQSNEYTSITDGVKASLVRPSPCLLFLLHSSD